MIVTTKKERTPDRGGEEKKMEKNYISKYNGYEYVIRQAAAGNWCVDIQPYAGEEQTYICFKTEDEAYSFVLGWEHGENPVFQEEEE